jgi:hypothetical protein
MEEEAGASLGKSGRFLSLACLEPWQEHSEDFLGHEKRKQLLGLVCPFLKGRIDRILSPQCAV